MTTPEFLRNAEAPKLFARIFVYGLLFFFAVLNVYPLIWTAMTSFKSLGEIFRYPPRFFPDTWMFSNYPDAWARGSWSRYFVNTFYVSSAVPLVTIVVSLFAGYTFTLKFRGASILLMLILGTMMIPNETTLVSKYLLMNYMRWIDTYWALIVPAVAGSLAFAIFLFRQFILTLPKDLEEAAHMDGCSRLRYLVFIVFPLSKSVALTVGLLTFVEEWSSVLWPLIVTNKDSMRVLQIGLKFFAGDSGVAYNLLSAACVYVSAPVLLLFFFVQKQFIEGVASTGIKG